MEGFDDEDLRTAVRNMPTGVSKVSMSGDFLTANHAFENLTGYAVSELRKLKLSELLPPEDRTTLATLMGEISRGTRTYFTLATSFCRKNNGVIFASVHAMAGLNMETGMTHIIVTADKREPRSIVYSNAGKGATVATDSEGSVKIMRSWKWLATATATALMSIAALIATWQTTHERSKLNAEGLRRVEDRLESISQMEREIQRMLREGGGR